MYVCWTCAHLSTVLSFLAFILQNKNLWLFQDSTTRTNPVVNKSGQNKQSLLRTLHRCLLPSLVRGDSFRNRPTRNKNCLWWQCLLTELEFWTNYTLLSISWHFVINYSQLPLHITITPSLMLRQYKIGIK
jgi:hypothetical protein